MLVLGIVIQDFFLFLFYEFRKLTKYLKEVPIIGLIKFSSLQYSLDLSYLANTIDLLVYSEMLGIRLALPHILEQ